MADLKSAVGFLFEGVDAARTLAWTDADRRCLVIDLEGYPDDFPMIGEEVERVGDDRCYTVVSAPFLNSNNDWVVPLSWSHHNWHATVPLTYLKWGKAKTQTYTIEVEVQATSQAEAESLVSIKGRMKNDHQRRSI